MTNRTQIATLPALSGALLLALAFGACSKDSSAADPTADGDETLPTLEELDVPTAAEAQKAADEEITPENADAEFEKLTKEIQGGD